MNLLSLLQNATINIESLKDYYLSQVDKITKSVEKEIKKYVPGMVVERYLFAMASHHEELLEGENGEKVKEVARRLVSDIEIGESEKTFSASYKLNEEFFKNNKWEMNPTKAAKEYQKLSVREEILNQSTLMMLLIKYEELIMGVFEYVITSYPNAYLKDKTLSYTEILEMDSKIEAVKEILLVREIDEIMRRPVSDWYKILSDKHKVDFKNLREIFEDFKVIYYRRNIIVHNNGIVNTIYINNVDKKKRENLKVGDVLTVDKAYLIKAFDLVYIMIYGTILNMSRISSDNLEIYNALQESAFQHMVDREWEISKFVYKNLLAEKSDDIPTADKEIWQVNYWISIKNADGLETIKEQISQHDVSVMEGKFKVAKACLLNEHSAVNELLEIYLNNEIRALDIETWPLFLQYRKSKEYRDFRKKHTKDFEKQNYEAENISRDEVTDEVLEMSEEIEGAGDSI